MARVPTLVLFLFACAATAYAQGDVHTLATRVDAHYNGLRSLRTAFTEQYSGMGQQRAEQGTLLLAKPGRMRWDYPGGKLFVLDGKYAISYTPGDAQAQRVPAKQLDSMRSPLRLLLGHTRLEKELDQLRAEPGPAGTVILTGVPRYATGPESSGLQQIALRIVPATGAITELELHGVDGTVTRFTFSQMQENVPASENEFHFVAPPGVAVIDGTPPI